MKISKERYERLLNFRIRCSAIGQIMTEAKGKTNIEKYEEAKVLIAKYQQEYNSMPVTQVKRKENKLTQIRKTNTLLLELEKNKNEITLSDTCITYLKKWVKETLYDRRQDLVNKYVKKGLAVEEDAISLYMRVMKTGFIKKNTVRKYNEFMEGECDLDLNDLVTDIKSSWDIFTFPNMEKEIPNPDYGDQLQGYMCLFEKPKSELAYCLVDTPKHIVEKQLSYHYSEIGSDYWTPEIEAAFRKGMAFSDIPEADRVKNFEVERNDERIEAINKKVIVCRQYINKHLLPLLNIEIE